MELFSCLLALSYFFISSSQLFWRSCNCVKCERTVSLNDNNSKNYFTAKHFKTSDSINLPPNLVSVKFHLFSDFLSYFLRFSSRTYPGTTLSIFWLVFERRCVICTDIKAFFFYTWLYLSVVTFLFVFCYIFLLNHRTPPLFLKIWAASRHLYPSANNEPLCVWTAARCSRRHRSHAASPNVTNAHGANSVATNSWPLAWLCQDLRSAGCACLSGVECSRRPVPSRFKVLKCFLLFVPLQFLCIRSCRELLQCGECIFFHAEHCGNSFIYGM